MKLLWLKNKYLLISIFGALALLTAVSATQHSLEKVRVKNVECMVINADSVPFISPAKGISLAEEDGFSFLGKLVNSLDLNNIEWRLEADPFIRSAEAYTTLEGTLHLKIWQRTPIARVIASNGESYYLDKGVQQIPILAGAPAEALLFAYPDGMANDQKTIFDSMACAWAAQLEADSFAAALIGQMEVSEAGKFTAWSRFASYPIILGDTGQISDKIDRMRLFFIRQQELGWPDYQSINLTFAGQIIAEKPNAANH